MEINNAIRILKSMQGYQSEGFYKDAVSAGIAALEEKNEREGMWILYGGDSTQEFRCSKCRKIIKIPGRLYYSECPYKYCPNCGKRNLNPHEKPEENKYD